MYAMNFVTSALKRRNGICMLFDLGRGAQLTSLSNLSVDCSEKKSDVATQCVDSDLPQEIVSNPFEREKIKCILCKHNIDIDYKNVRLLSQFVSRYTGKIYGRHITRLCKSQQQRVEKAIFKAQSSGLMATVIRDLEFANDPKLFNPEQPIRPHRF